MQHIFTSIDCPLCFSNNSIEIGNRNEQIKCSDCGFVLTEKINLNENKQLDKCIFCGSQYFFKERRFLKFWIKRPVCQGCFAHYENINFSEYATVEDKYNEQSCKKVFESNNWKMWENRVISNGGGKEIIYYWHNKTNFE